jgi:hypothetical protein
MPLRGSADEARWMPEHVRHDEVGDNDLPLDSAVHTDY